MKDGVIQLLQVLLFRGIRFPPQCVALDTRLEANWKGGICLPERSGIFTCLFRTTG